ncbi:MAG: dephospho-CoA kinase [Clostridiaceae bacterium]|nr:dephospho-CoA kinase [Clostridiaceae bacterium]
MFKIGLTGGIGSGKSTVSKMLKSLSITVIDVDIVAREVLILYPQILEKVRLDFGDYFFDELGELKRSQFGDYIFKDEDKRKRYEAIIVPYIIKQIFIRIEECYKVGCDICVVDAPTLIENNLHINMDINILVWVDKETQIERIVIRDQISKEKAQLRIDAQINLDEKRELVDYIIDNSSTIEDTEEQLKYVLNEIYSRGIK